MPRKNARPAAKKRKAKLAALMATPKHERVRREQRRMPPIPPDLIMAEMSAASVLLSRLLYFNDKATRP